jgi:hypothetical protein
MLWGLYPIIAGALLLVDLPLFNKIVQAIAGPLGLAFKPWTLNSASAMLGCLAIGVGTYYLFAWYDRNVQFARSTVFVRLLFVALCALQTWRGAMDTGSFALVVLDVPSALLTMAALNHREVDAKKAN